MERLAIFPGTFDPFTLGHLDVVERAARLFDTVEIVVGVNDEKMSLLSAEERQDLIRRSTDHLPNIVVASFEGLVSSYAAGRGAVALIRGLRQSGDFEYETRMAFANAELASGLETVLLATTPRVAFISSTVVRDIHRWGGDIRPFVPAVVAEALERRR
ncbi:MAG: pantetheine-phosphate adenylyltransferase [Rhodothermales bacterium]|jgi:pantetheine-phosphate adenylyltransferase|nr:pantetheine-phosphate adenylyltransferase [Rhodothermales bacterium]